MRAPTARHRLARFARHARFGIVPPLLLLGLLLAPAALAAPAGTRLWAAPAPAPAAPARQPAIARSGPWTNVGPNMMPGRFHCVAADMLHLPMVACGADGSGYWWGYGYYDTPWEERGRELGSGIRQMTARLNFPEGADYYQRWSVVGTDGRMRNTIDDGLTWSPDTLNAWEGYTLGAIRQLGYDCTSVNVAYVLAYGSDDLGRDGVALLRSFDGGQVYDMTRFVPTRRAHLWSSRRGSGQILLAYEDGAGNVVVERNDGLGDPGYWHPLATVADPGGAPESDSIFVVAQEATDPDSMRVWVVTQGHLLRSTDAGASWSAVGQFPSGTERCIGASLLTPDLLFWTTGDAHAYWSPDGGVTPHAIPTSPFPNWGELHSQGGDVDCFAWTFAPAPRCVARPAGGGTGAVERVPVPDGIARRAATAPGGVTDVDEERFYVSTGGGVFVWNPADTTATPLTLSDVVTQQVQDVLSLRESQDHHGCILATRDQGVLGTAAVGPVLPGQDFWTFGITSALNDVGHVVSCGKPTPADPVAFGDLPYGNLIVFGDGVFTGVGISTGGNRHAAMVADPAGPYRFWVACEALYRATWNRVANAWDVTAVPSPLDWGGAFGIGVAIAPSNAARMYLLTRDGSAYWTANGGTTWTQGIVSGASPLPVEPDAFHYVNMAVNPHDPLEAWAAGTTVLHTTDGGAHWNTVLAGLPLPANAWDVAFDGTTAGGVYLAADSGPYRLTGGTWTDLAPAGGDVPAVPFRAVEGLPWRGTMRWGTWGRGVWDYATGNPAGVDAPAHTELALSARQNPVRDLARLDFALPQAGPVRIELLDVAGRCVRTLADGDYPAGRGSAPLDPRGLASGVYFARLSTAQAARSVRVIVLQ